MAISAYYHVTVAGAGTKTGASWANAFGEPEWETHMEGSLATGEVFFIEDGTYTLDSTIDWSATAGTAVAPIVLQGVLSGTTNEGSSVVYADFSIADADKPFFDLVTFNMVASAFNIVRGISFQGSANEAVDMPANCIRENCKFDNDVGSSSSNYALGAAGSGGMTIDCELTSANGNGGIGAFQTSNYINCYLHDIPNATGGAAVNSSGSSTSYYGNIFDECRLAITGISNSNIILNNTFYETDTGVSGSTRTGCVCINNLMEGNNTAGFSWSTQTDFSFFDSNHGDDTRCTDMWNNVEVTSPLFKDNNVVTGDPKFTTPGSDFRLQDTSPDIDAGAGVTKGVG